jgi:hypothetical protein
MLPPFYYKGVSDEGLYRYFSSVIEAVGDERCVLHERRGWLERKEIGARGAAPFSGAGSRPHGLTGNEALFFPFFFLKEQKTQPIPLHCFQTHTHTHTHD